MTDKLYHYTDFNGLNGILKDKCLWATNVFASNDHSEIRLGCELLKATLLECAEKEGWALEDINFDLDFLLYASIDHAMSRGIFLTCFSTIQKSLSDKNKKYTATNGLLSQWRGYGSYAIKFQKEIIENYLKKWPTDHSYGILVANLTDNVVYLGKEDFEEFNQHPLINNSIGIIKIILSSERWRDVRKKINKNELMEEDYQPIQELINRILMCGFIVKNKGFEEEQEVRILNIVLPKSHDKREVHFHSPTRSHIKLFSENPNIIKSAIKEIIIGPMPHQELGKRQVESMLEQYGFSVNRTNHLDENKVTVKCSEIPFIKR